MKLLRYSWDLFFGVLLIGGAPWCVVASLIILGDLFQSVSHLIVPEAVFAVLFFLSLAGAVAAFAFAIRHRVRQRVLPPGFLVLEILLGLGGAFILFGFYGVVMYSIVG